MLHISLVSKYCTTRLYFCVSNSNGSKMNTNTTISMFAIRYFHQFTVALYFSPSDFTNSIIRPYNLLAAIKIYLHANKTEIIVKMAGILTVLNNGGKKEHVICEEENTFLVIIMIWCGRIGGGLQLTVSTH